VWFTFEFASFVLFVILFVCEWLCHVSSHCYNVYVVTIYIGLWVTVSHFLSIVTMYTWLRYTLVCKWLCHTSFPLLQYIRGYDIHWFVSDCVTLPFHCYNIYVVTICIGFWVTSEGKVRRHAQRSRPFLLGHVTGPFPVYIRL